MRDPLLDRPSFLPRWFPSVDGDLGLRIFRWSLAVVFAAGVAACVARSADDPADPELGAPVTTTPSVPATPSGPTTAPAGAEPIGTQDAGDLADEFGTTLIRLVLAANRVLELCTIHADSPIERSRGLMQVGDLRGYDGMTFSNEAESSGSYYMFNTVMPLSISWWDDDGAFVSGTDMVPCTAADASECPLYPAAGPFRYALEVPLGALDTASFGAGSRLEVTGEACEPA